MSNDIQYNKKIVREFYELAFNERKPEEACRKYMGSYYRQHNPQAADGAEAFIGFVKYFTGEFPELKVNIKRMIAENDLVAVHCNMQRYPGDRGLAVMDILRVEDGKVVEHWDVIQEIPEKSANNNTMF